jgi:beta-mannosidase
MRISLNGEWKLRYHLEEKNMPEVSMWPEITAQVPGNVELDLWRAGVEKDPFYAENIYDYRKYEFYRWQFERCFTVDEVPADGRLLMVFEGLNTYADVIVNGKNVGYADNMFIAHKFDVTDAVKVGENEVKVVIYSGTNIARELDYPVSVQGAEGSDEFVFQRRPPSDHEDH